MLRGIIKFFSEYRGYGFISCDGAAVEPDAGPREVLSELSSVEEVYVHYSQIRGGSPPREGQRVTFDLKNGDRGPEAVNVRLVS